MAELVLTGLTSVVEVLARVLADRLEHPVPLVRETQQALLDEGLHRVELGVHYLSRGLQRAPASEQRERAEETLFLARDQVVTPLDRRAQCLLAGIGIAAAAQEVEALREATEDLARGERLRACSSELEGEWEIVEASAELGDLVRGLEPRA